MGVTGEEPLERDVVIRHLVDDACEDITVRYGSGKNDGQLPLAYHNVHHTLDVINASTGIARVAKGVGKISLTDIGLVELAAAYHDYEHSKGSGSNELASAAVVTERMKKSSVFEDQEVARVRSMIMATVVAWDENGVMEQAVNEDYLTQIIADADLSPLGLPPAEFWDRAFRILLEMKGSYAVSADDIREFLNIELTVLLGHDFHTPEAASLFGHRLENIAFVKQHQRDCATS